MSTATADPTSAKIAFVSSTSPDLKLIRRPVRYETDGEGVRQPVGEAEWVARQERLNEARLERGEDPLPIDDCPWEVQFERGMYVVPDGLSEAGRERLLNFLRGHKLSGVPRGFFEQIVGGPTETEQLTKIGEAAALGDIESVEAILDAEKKTHNRESILVTADAALTRLRQLESGVPGDVAGDDGDAGESRPDQEPPQ